MEEFNNTPFDGNLVPPVADQVEQALQEAAAQILAEHAVGQTAEAIVADPQDPATRVLRDAAATVDASPWALPENIPEPSEEVERALRNAEISIALEALFAQLKDARKSAPGIDTSGIDLVESQRVIDDLNAAREAKPPLFDPLAANDYKTLTGKKPSALAHLAKELQAQIPEEYRRPDTSDPDSKTDQ